MRRVVLALLLAGCLAPAAPAGDAALVVAPVEDHDHALAAGHDAAIGLREVARLPLDDLLAGEPGRASDIQLHDDLAAVAVNGGSGGFVLLDASDAPTLRPLARYRSGSEDNWYVKFTPDGRHVLLTANGNLAPVPAATSALEGAARGAYGHAARGLQVVDVTDPTAPRLVGAYAAPVRLINAATWEQDGMTLVAVSVVNDPRVEGAPSAAANDVRILRLDDGPAGVTFAELSRWAVPAPATGLGFAHDLAVEAHPLTGATLLHVAGWDAGAFWLDVTEPSAPAVVGAFLPAVERPQVHTVKPHPGLVDGRHLTLVTPETFGGEESGRYHLLDTTDPAAPALVATWELADLVNAEPLLWSPHEFTLADGKAYVSGFHAGVLVLDLRAGLAPIAWWAEGDDADDRGRWAVDVETAVWRDGVVYAVDMGRGVVALQPG